MFDCKKNKKEKKKENWRWEAEVDRDHTPKSKEEKGRKVRVEDLLRAGEFDSEELYR